MSFYKTVNIFLEALDGEKITGKELIQSYAMSFFDMEREATIIYDFLEENGYLRMGMYMGVTDEKSHDPYGNPNFYLIIPRTVVVDKRKVLINFFDKYKKVAQKNNFHFLVRAGEDMLIDGKELIYSKYGIVRWKPMKKKTREHFGDIIGNL